MDANFTLPDSYANVLKYAPESVRPMAQAALEMKAKQQQVVQQQLLDQKQALQSQHQSNVDSLNKEIDSTPEDLKKYPAVQHDINREKAMLDYGLNSRLLELSSYGMEQNAAQSYIKNESKLLDNQFAGKLKPFEETPQYKIATENWDVLKKKQPNLDIAKEQLQTAQNIYDQAMQFKANGDLAGFEKKSKEATNFMKTNFIKTLNSIVSNDAIQLSEMITRYPDLLTGTQYAQLTNSSTFNPRVWVNRLFEKGNEVDKDQTIKQIFNNIQNADPGKFLVNATQGVNSVLNAHNKEVENQVYRTSSPGVGKRLGAVPYDLFDENKMGVNKYAVENAPQPTQSGSTYRPSPAPVTSQAQQPAVAQPQSYSPAMIDLAKKAIASPDANEQHKARAREILGIK
jgi:hypothetical protein